MAMGQDEIAIQHNQTALAIDSVHIPTYRNLSTLQYRIGQLEEATETLLQFMQVKPFDNYVYMAYAEIQLERGKQREAEEALRFRISSWQNEGIPQQTERLHAEIPMRLAEILMNQGRFSEAHHFVDMMEKHAQRSIPKSADIELWSWRLRAYILQRQNKPENVYWANKSAERCRQYPMDICRANFSTIQYSSPILGTTPTK